jgi:hypothetical protein
VRSFGKLLQGCGLMYSATNPRWSAGWFPEATLLYISQGLYVLCTSWYIHCYGAQKKCHRLSKFEVRSSSPPGNNWKALAPHEDCASDNLAL